MGFRRAKLLSPKAVVGISVLCMLALLPDPSSLLSDHVDAALRESAKGKDTVREIGPSYFFYTKKEKKGCLLSFQCHCPISESSLSVLSKKNSQSSVQKAFFFQNLNE